MAQYCGPHLAIELQCTIFINIKTYPISDVANPVVSCSEEIPLVNIAFRDIIVFRLGLTICMPFSKQQQQKKRHLSICIECYYACMYY